MSTKIFHAYRCSFETIDQMHERFMEIRKPINDEMKRQFYKRCAQEWTVYIDDRTITGKPIKKHFYDIAMDVSTKSDKMKESGNYDPTYDFLFEVVVIPFKGKQYAKIFCHDKYLHLVEHIEKFAEDYHYQNCTDRPEDISEKEWEERERTWDKILSQTKTGIWLQLGFTYDFSIIWADAPFRYKEIKRYIPGKRLRAQRIAVNRIYKRRIRGKKLDKKGKVSEYFETIEYIKTDEGQKELKKKIKSIIRKLADIDEIGDNIK